jgi:hypothetical protein
MLKELQRVHNSFLQMMEAEQGTGVGTDGGIRTCKDKKQLFGRETVSL